MTAPLAREAEGGTVTESLTVQAREVLADVAGKGRFSPSLSITADEAVTAMLAVAHFQCGTILKQCAQILEARAVSLRTPAGRAAAQWHEADAAMVAGELERQARVIVRTDIHTTPPFAQTQRAAIIEACAGVADEGEARMVEIWDATYALRDMIRVQLQPGSESLRAEYEAANALHYLVGGRRNVPAAIRKLKEEG